MFQKVYVTDPTAQLLALLWAGGKPTVELLERVSQQHYGQGLSLVARAFNIAAGIYKKITGGR